MTPNLAPVRAIAHARAGDKGDTCNIAVVAYTAAAYSVLVRELTAARVRRHFRHRGVERVQRFRLDDLHAVNFVLRGALEGGVNSSLGLDGHGKALSFHLLQLEVPVPADVVEACQRASAVAWPERL